MRHLCLSAARQQTQRGQRIDAKHAPGHQRNDDAAHANAAPAHAEAAAGTAPVFHIVRLSIAFPFHRKCSRVPNLQMKRW